MPFYCFEKEAWLTGCAKKHLDHCKLCYLLEYHFDLCERCLTTTAEEEATAALEVLEELAMEASASASMDMVKQEV